MMLIDSSTCPLIVQILNLNENTLADLTVHEFLETIVANLFTYVSKPGQKPLNYTGL